MKDIKVTLKKVVSKKNGKTYVIVEIPISPSYTKTVFLKDFEKDLIELQFKDI